MSNDDDTDKNFLEMVVKALVDNADAVSVAKKVDERGVLLTLTVAPDERGKIIGRSGRTRDAIRTLLRAVGRKHNAYVGFRLDDDDDNRDHRDHRDNRRDDNRRDGPSEM